MYVIYSVGLRISWLWKLNAIIEKLDIILKLKKLKQSKK